MGRTGLLGVAAAAILLLVLVASTHRLPGAAANLVCRDPDCGKNVTQLIEARGYPVQDYAVATSDGYLLGVQRIPNGRGNHTLPAPGEKPAVVVWHGLLDAAHSWVINFAEQSLGFILADAGYDVYLGNSRGNSYSLHNTQWSTGSKQFWQFSWDEMALLDVPAVIDFALQQSGRASLFYVGHSQGTMQAFAAFEDAAVAAKVDLFVALAPVAFLGNIEVPLLRDLADIDLGQLLQLLGERRFLPNEKLLDWLDPALCDLDPTACQLMLCALVGCDMSNLNQTRFPVYVQLDPAGTSVQNMLHYAQGVKSDLFQHYDYGSAAANQQHYGQPTPPPWNASALACDVAIFSGSRDLMADPADVAHLLQLLPPERVVFHQNLANYSHIDWIWGLNAAVDVYHPIVSLFDARSER